MHGVARELAFCIEGDAGTVGTMETQTTALSCLRNSSSAWLFFP